MSFFLLSLLSALVTFSVSTAKNSSCYYPSGVESRGQPCYADADVSACCGPTFVCMSNGLCEPGPDSKRTYSYKYYRSGCTDPSWNSTTCPQFCLEPSDNRDAGQGLQNCGNNQYCCAETYDCCTNSTNVFTLDVANVVTTIPAPSASSTSTSSPSKGASVSGSGSSASNNAVAIGVGVGVGVGVLLALLILGFVVLQRRRYRRDSPSKHTKGREDRKGNEQPLDKYDSKEGYMAPVGAEEGRPELESYPRARITEEPQELEHRPRFEMGRTPSPEAKDRHEQAREFPGRYFKEDGTFRHEAP